MNHTVVVLVGSVHRGVLEALAYAKSLRPNRLLAVTVVSDDEEQETHRASSGRERDIDVPLEIVHSPYRELRARSCASSTSSTPATTTTSSPS